MRQDAAPVDTLHLHDLSRRVEALADARRLRNAEAARLYGEGMPASELARIMGVSPRAVYQMLDH
jgi:DNA-directed RNA polymerase specialized sigma24 family protein